MYLKQSVKKPQGNKSPGAPAPKEPNVTIIDVDDILVHPQRDEKGVLMLGSYVMKPNAHMIQVYMTPSKIKASYESEGDEDAQAFKQKVEGESPGDDLEKAEFIQNWTGRNCIIILGSCADNFKKVYGSKCAPLQLKPSLQDDNEARKSMFVFEQAAATGYVPGHYLGELVLENIPSSSTSAIAVSNSTLMHKMPALSTTAPITFTSITADANKVITLIGSGGTNPPTLANGDEVLLKNGTSWVALDGAVIHLQVFEGVTKTLIELSRE